MNLKLGGYELEAGWSGGGLGSYYSKLEMPDLLLCTVLKIVILGNVEWLSFLTWQCRLAVAIGGCYMYVAIDW